MAEEFNPFGLVDERTLRSIRGEQVRDQFNLGQQGQTGVGQGAHALGFALGRGAKLLGRRTGLLEDREGERAKGVTAAQKRADAAFAAIPDEIREKDPFGVAIQRRKELIAELETEGLSEDASAVRKQIISLSEQQEKFLKSQGERTKQDLEIKTMKREEDAASKGLREKDETTRTLNLLQQLDPADPVQAAQMDRLNARLDKLTQITGTTEFDPAASDKVTVRKLEDSIIQNQTSLDGFVKARELFDPSYLTLTGKVKNFGIKMADIAGLPLDDDTKQGLRDFAVFKQQTSTSLNAYIKAVTGAQMSNPEAVRLKKDVPTLDDSPEEYQAKLDATVAKLHGYNARAMAAMGQIDDRQEFLKILTSPVDNYLDQGVGNVGETSQNNAAAQAEAILSELEAELGLTGGQ